MNTFGYEMNIPLPQEVYHNPGRESVYKLLKNIKEGPYTPSRHLNINILIFEYFLPFYSRSLSSERDNRTL